MKKEIIYELKPLYRDAVRVTGYRFGNGEKTLCIMGIFRGNEVQQLYICSQLIKRLREMEEKGLLNTKKEVLVIPCANSASINIGKRFWPTDNTDINRMFPGYEQGETTQRIAAGVFREIKDYEYGIQFASNYMPGEFIPHIRIMKTGFEGVEEAKDFGLPFIVTKDPKPYDTTTLNYNWQIWNCKAYSMYSSESSRIDVTSANETIDAVINFMAKKGICSADKKMVGESKVLNESTLCRIKNKHAGILDCKVEVKKQVKKNDVLAQIIDPYEGNVIEKVLAPKDGVIFYRNSNPLMYANTVLFKLLEE